MNDPVQNPDQAGDYKAQAQTDYRQNPVEGQGERTEAERPHAHEQSLSNDELDLCSSRVRRAPSCKGPGGALINDHFGKEFDATSKQEEKD